MRAGTKTMGKEKQPKRFVQIFEEGFNLFGPESSLVVDRQTGVTYLIIRNTFGSGITPLLSADGKPVITDLKNMPEIG